MPAWAGVSEKWWIRGWPDTPGGAWRGGLIMSGTVDPMATEVDQQALAQQLLTQAREQGIELVGPDGLLNRLTRKCPGGPK
jgi:hypothetical protein